MNGPAADQTVAKKKRKKRALPATVTGRTELSADMVRLSFSCPAIIGMDLPFSDHYVKLLFVPEDAGYAWPFDLAEVRATLPRAKHPVMRTYTLRHIDTDAGSFDIDFVLHGDSGLAGPWAARVEPGAVIPFAGPGGKWAPDPAAGHHVLVGDESALPAVAEGIAALGEDATADVFLEVRDETTHVELPQRAGVTVHWIHRGAATPGTELTRAVEEFGVPDTAAEHPCHWFVHGVAEMVRDLRRFLFVDNHLPRECVNVSGYWRLGMVEDEWQASKRAFNAEIEAAEATG